MKEGKENVRYFVEKEIKVFCLDFFHNLTFKVAYRIFQMKKLQKNGELFN